MLCGFQRNFLKQKLIDVNSFNAFSALSHLRRRENLFEKPSPLIQNLFLVALKFYSDIIRNIFLLLSFFRCRNIEKAFCSIVYLCTHSEKGPSHLMREPKKDCRGRGENIPQQVFNRVYRQTTIKGSKRNAYCTRN